MNFASYLLRSYSLLSIAVCEGLVSKVICDLGTPLALSGNASIVALIVV